MQPAKPFLQLRQKDFEELQKAIKKNVINNTNRKELPKDKDKNECAGCSKCKCKKRFKQFLKENADPSHPPFGTPEYFNYLSQLNDLGHIWHGLNNFRTWAQLQYDSQPGDKSEPMLYASEASYDIMNAIKSGVQIDKVKQALSTLPGYLSGMRSMYNKSPFEEMAGGDAIVGSCKGGPDFQVMGACSDLKKKKRKR